MVEVRVWRPSVGSRLAALALGLIALGMTLWLWGDPITSTRDRVLDVVVDIAAVVLVPTALFRQRMVLGTDELVLVFLRTRRLPLKEIVEARLVVNDGLTFVCRDGSRDSYGMLGHLPLWARHRPRPTEADEAARAVLCAAAIARGEAPPVDYLLPPMTGRKEALVRGGIWAVIVGFILGS